MSCFISELFGQLLQNRKILDFKLVYLLKVCHEELQMGRTFLQNFQKFPKIQSFLIVTVLNNIWRFLIMNNLKRINKKNIGLLLFQMLRRKQSYIRSALVCNHFLRVRVKIWRGHTRASAWSVLLQGLCCRATAHCRRIQISLITWREVISAWSQRFGCRAQWTECRRIWFSN